MAHRITRRLERILQRVPVGGDTLRAMTDVVGDDLAADVELEDLLGPDHEIDIGAFVDPIDPLPRVRPILVALAARAAGAAGDVDTELQHAAELLHVALVVHDVTLGQKGGRRRRVARKVVRRSVGWLGGNPLTLRALELVRSTPGHPEILGELVDTLRELSDGQALVSALKQEAAFPTAEDWLDHADAHNGALFSFCCRAGAHLGHTDVATVSALGRYGRHLGRLWNVAEDVAYFRSGEPGDHLYARAISGRPVLPVAAAAASSDAIGRDWSRLVAHPNPILANDLADRVVRLGGVNGARHTMARESWAASRALQGLPDSRYRRAMERLASGMARHVA